MITRLTLRHRSSPLALFLLGGLLLSLLTGCALSADITPPADYQQSYIARETESDPEVPVSSLNLELGRQVYQQYCAACHAENGAGITQADLSDPATLYTRSPRNLYDIISRGSQQMPAFEEMLTATDRWDVITYIYSLGYSTEMLNQGQLIFTNRCQSCHQSGASAPNWQDPMALISLSDQEIVQITANGTSDGMPAFSAIASSDNLAAAAAYIRSQAFGRQPGTAATTTPGPRAGITGRVFNITNKSSTAGLQVSLLGYHESPQSPDFVLNGTLDSTGQYLFKDVEIVEERSYIVAVLYQGVLYYSSPIVAREMVNDSLIHRPVEVYEASRDVSQLSIERMQILLDIGEDGNLQVMEMLLLNNPLSVAVIGADDTSPVVTIPLPTRAANIRFSDASNGRYLVTASGFADFLPVQPGAVHQILFAYDLPYNGKLSLSVPISMPTSQVTILVPVGSLKLTGSQLTSLGQKSLNGVQVDLYTAAGLPANSELTLNINGRMNQSLALRSNSATNLGLGLIIFSIVLALAVWVYWRQIRIREQAQVLVPLRTPEEIMDAIIALDDRFQAGDLDEDIYLRKRAELKDLLRSQVEKPST